MSIESVNAGQWVRCAAMGWPLDRLGPDAEVWIDPLPSELYNTGIAAVSKEMAGRHPRDSPRFYSAVEKELPRVYAAAVMTKMRGIRLTADGEVLEDTQANRRAVLMACPLLAERVYRLATRGLAGIEDLEWRSVAVRLRGAIKEALAVLSVRVDEMEPGHDAAELVAEARAILDAIEITKVPS